ncbi:hypothetical protein ABTB39_19865, partial [Acinetobacter baumannii]
NVTPICAVALIQIKFAAVQDRTVKDEGTGLRTGLECAIPRVEPPGDLRRWAPTNFWATHAAGRPG